MPPLLLLLPFIAMLLAIAVVPLVNRHHWEKRYPLYALGLGALSLVGMSVNGLDLVRLGHTAHEYVSFIALVGSLFVISGGIHLGVRRESTTLGNVAFLAVAAVLANFIGTTGASMLFIRPWMRLNRGRLRPYHIVFFIFTVSNVGGGLTPIGDPPLFLGYLKGVPFWWVLTHCWQPWLFAMSALLILFYIVDRRNIASPVEPDPGTTPLISGAWNFAFLLVVLGAVFVKSPPFLREGLMLAAALGSYLTTPRAVHAANAFNFEPIREVAWLFLGIFATMIPALEILQANAPQLGLSAPSDYYWATGLLSGLLDNAPTYLAFLATAFGSVGLSLDHEMPAFLAAHGAKLAAISCGAVFFGAMTYIGNGPNFMVKAIAEQARVPMPGFFRYIYAYAIPILLPVFLAVALLFF